jgi:hypothetical protein
MFAQYRVMRQLFRDAMRCKGEKFCSVCHDLFVQAESVPFLSERCIIAFALARRSFELNGLAPAYLRKIVNSSSVGTMEDAMVTVLDYVFLVALFIVGAGICVAVWTYQRKQRQTKSTEPGATNDSQSNQ